MRKRLNIPLAGGLIIGAVFFAGFTHWWHGIQVRRNADGLLRRAAVAREEGDLPETVRLTRRYLAHRPDDNDQFYQIALDAKQNLFDMVAARKQPDRKSVDLTMFLMEEAVRKSGFLVKEDGKPDIDRRQNIRREAAEFWIAFRRFDIAKDNLEAIEDAWTVDDRMQFIECLRLLGSPVEEDRAIILLEQMIGLDSATGKFDTEAAEHPELLNAYQSLVNLLVQKRLDRDMAEKVIDQMVAVNPENPEAYLSYYRLIRYIRQAEGKEKAYAAIAKAYELDKENVDIMASVAAVNLEQKKYEEAKTLLEDGLAKATTIREKSRIYDLLAQAYITAGDLEGAMVILDRGNKEVPNDRELLWKKARLLLEEKQHAEVEKLYKPLERANTSPALIAYLQARILMDQGDYKRSTKAMAQIRPLVQPLLRMEIDNFLSGGYGVLGQHDKRRESLENLLKANPNHPKAQEGYVQALMFEGQNQRALDYLEFVIQERKKRGEEIPPELNFQLTKLRVQLKIGEAREEVSQADIKNIQKDLNALFKNKDLPETQRMALVIDYFRKMNQPEKARQYVIKALESNRDSFPLWALRLDYAESMDEANQLLEEVRSIVDVEKHEMTLRGMEAKLTIKHDRENIDAVMARLQKNIDSYPPEQQAGLLYELGSLQFLLQNRTEAVRLLEQASKLAPERLDILSTLLRDATQRTDVARVNDIVGRIKQVAGTDDDTWRIAEATRLIWLLRQQTVSANDRQRMLTEAATHMRVARSNRPDHIPVLMLQADIERESGQTLNSIETLKRAHDLQPGNATVIRLIALSYKDIENRPMMDEWMKRLPLSMRSDQDKRVELSSIWRRRSKWTPQDTDYALRLVKEIVPDDSTQPLDWVLRSQVELKSKKFDEALASANKAREIRASLADVWTNLVNVLVDMDRKAEAEEAIQEAELELPEDVKPVALGRCYSILGNNNLAQANFAAAIRSDPENASVKKMYAETLIADQKSQQAAGVIESILNSNDPEKYQSEITWGRRKLAQLLSATDSYENFNKGLELLEKNRKDGDLKSEDLALWIFLCFARPEKESWDRALLKLDEVLQKRPLNDDELFMKAQLYEKYEDKVLWEKAKEITMEVLSRNNGNQQVIENYVRWLLKRGELAEARRFASNNLAQTAVTRLRVELHSDVQEGNSAQALRKIQQRIPPSPKNQQELSTLLTLSAIAEELGQYDPQFFGVAEGLLKQLAQAAPREILRLATTMGVHGDIEKIKTALNYCKTSGKFGVSAPIRAGVALAILREHQSDWDGELKDAVRDIGAWLDEMAAATPEDTTLQWRVAEFSDMIGNLDRAELEYDKLLKNPKFTSPVDRGMVMNNLAYSMALNGKSDRPLELVEEAEKRFLGPTSDLIDTKGFVYLVRGDYEKAISNFTKALGSGPGQAQKLFHLAIALDKNSRTQDAQERWTEALEAGLDRFRLPPSLQDEYDDFKLRFGATPVAVSLN